MALAVRPISSAEHLGVPRVAAVGVVPAVPVVGRGQAGVGQRRASAGTTTRRHPRRRRPGAAAAGAEGEAVPRLPAGGPGARLGRPTTWRPGWTPMVEHLRERGRVRREDGPAGRAPALVGRHRQGRHRRRAARSGWPTYRLTSTDAVGERVATALARAGLAAAVDRRGGFAAGQPQYVFQVPLGGRDRGRAAEGLQPAVAAQHQEGREARRRRCGRARPTTCRRSTRSTSRPPSATTSPAGRCRTSSGCGTAMRAEDPDRIRLYLAEHEGDLVAATTMVRVGEHAWYSYGASSTAKREVRGSNAVQWAMLRDAAGRRGHGLRPARHHRHAGRGRPALRADPVQARHRRRGGRVPR